MTSSRCACGRVALPHSDRCGHCRNLERLMYTRAWSIHREARRRPSAKYYEVFTVTSNGGRIGPRLLEV